MSQKLIIAIMGAVILAGGGVWYYQNNIAGSSDNATNSRSSGRDSGEKSGGFFDSLKGGAGNFADILNGGDAQECHFSGTDPETKEYTEGVIYVDGESFRMTADTEVEGKPVKINMIQHEMVMYMWSDDEKVMPGIKIDTSMFEDLPDSEKPESPIEWLKDPKAGVDYKCRGWSARANSFEPPADVEFMDMFAGLGQMFGGMMEAMNEDMGGFDGGYDDSWDY